MPNSKQLEGLKQLECLEAIRLECFKRLEGFIRLEGLEAIRLESLKNTERKMVDWVDWVD